MIEWNGLPSPSPRLCRRVATIAIIIITLLCVPAFFVGIGSTTVTIGALMGLLGATGLLWRHGRVATVPARRTQP